ncbi:hypothetical protein ACH47C_26935 [Streptomyces rishiriensis]|uniref:hypothetical protein n=1 Tax=Streptomyces rishiriensis TaxID=68264 RepID=UPI0033D8ADE3
MNPDHAYDPSESAARTLRNLDYNPGAQPIAQLRQVAADALGAVRQSAATRPEASAATALAHTQLLQAAVTALCTLAENDLDEMEQQRLAAEFGLSEPGGQS